MPSTTAPNPEDAGIGATIRALREARELTITQLAEKVGVSRQFMGFIESGKRHAGLAHIRAIAETLDVPLDAINGAAVKRLRALADALEKEAS